MKKKTLMKNLKDCQDVCVCPKGLSRSDTEFVDIRQKVCLMSMNINCQTCGIAISCRNYRYIWVCVNADQPLVHSWRGVLCDGAELHQLAFRDHDLAITGVTAGGALPPPWLLVRSLHFSLIATMLG